MASKFPGDFGQGFVPLPFMGENRLPFSPPFQRTLTIPEALQITKSDWNEIKIRMADYNSALTKLLGKSTEKPTLGKVFSSWNEKRDAGILTMPETHVLQIFFGALSRLQRVKDAMPIGQLLKERIDLNTILSDTTVHSTVHHEVAEIANKGTHISSRFRATVSVIPRLLDCLCPMVGIPIDERPKKHETDGARARSPSPNQSGKSQDRVRRLSGEKPAETPQKETRSKETHQQPAGAAPTNKQTPFFEEEVLIGHPDVDFQMMQSCDGKQFLIFNDLQDQNYLFELNKSTTNL